MNEDRLPWAFLDASALYPSFLRNILMRLALRDLFRGFWSERVQDEWTRAVLRDRPHVSPASIDGTRKLMDENIDDAIVGGYEHLIATVTLPDLDDRHVLAAAIHCARTSSSPQICETFRAKHFQHTASKHSTPTLSFSISSERLRAKLSPRSANCAAISSIRR